MLRTYVDRRASMEEIWAAGVFPELGAGDVDVSGFVAALIAGGYEGWVVVEQDRVLRPGQPFGPIVEEQERNLATLRALGLQSQRT
jgi:inosose dehydratase